MKDYQEPGGGGECEERKTLQALLRALFSLERFAVLATQGHGQPYTHLVAFAAEEDLNCLLFVTPRATRKFANLSENPRVAMMIDNRKNEVSDVHDAVAVTAVGMAEEVQGGRRKDLLKRYLSRHPFMETFAKSPSCALVRVSVQKYDIVRKFQNVVELRVFS